MNVKDVKICNAAIVVFQTMLDSVYNGSITPFMLKKLEDKLSQVNKIIEAIDYKKGDKLLPSPKEMLSRRKLEYAGFQKVCQQLQHLCHHISDLNVKG